MRIKSIFAPLAGRAGVKLAAVLALCVASLGLFSAEGRYVLAKQGVLPNLDFAEGSKYWSGSQGGVAVRTGPPTVLVLSGGARRQTLVSQDMQNPTAYRNIRIGADVKIDNVADGIGWWQRAGIVLQSIDENGAKMSYWPSTVALLSGSAPWRRIDAVIPVAENAKWMQFTIFLTGDSGKMSLRNIVVDALDPAPWFTIARNFLIALWIGAGLWIIVPLLRRKRRSIPAYGALFVLAATIAGVLTPQPQLSQFVGAARALFDRAAAPALPEAPRRDEKADSPAKPARDAAPDRRSGTRAPSPSAQIIAALPSTVTQGGGMSAAHFAVHAALAFLIFLAFGEVAWALLVTYLVTVAAVTEILQVFIITRETSLADGGFNLAGIAVGIAAYFLWRIAAPYGHGFISRMSKPRLRSSR